MTPEQRIHRNLERICDAAGVEYVYATLGKDSVLQFRPSGL